MKKYLEIVEKGFIALGPDECITESELENNKREFFKRVDNIISYIINNIEYDCYFVLRIPTRCAKSFDSTEIITFDYDQQDEILCVPNCSNLLSLVTLSNNTTEIQLFILIDEGDKND